MAQALGSTAEDFQRVVVLYEGESDAAATTRTVRIIDEHVDDDDNGGTSSNQRQGTTQNAKHIEGISRTMSLKMVREWINQRAEKSAMTDVVPKYYCFNSGSTILHPDKEYMTLGEYLRQEAWYPLEQIGDLFSPNPTKITAVIRIAPTIVISIPNTIELRSPRDATWPIPIIYASRHSVPVEANEAIQSATPLSQHQHSYRDTKERFVDLVLRKSDTFFAFKIGQRRSLFVFDPDATINQIWDEILNFYGLGDREPRSIWNEIFYSGKRTDFDSDEQLIEDFLAKKYQSLDQLRFVPDHSDRGWTFSQILGFSPTFQSQIVGSDINIRNGIIHMQWNCDETRPPTGPKSLTLQLEIVHVEPIESKVDEELLQKLADQFEDGRLNQSQGRLTAASGFLDKVSESLDDLQGKKEGVSNAVENLGKLFSSSSIKQLSDFLDHLEILPLINNAIKVLRYVATHIAMIAENQSEIRELGESVENLKCALEYRHKAYFSEAARYVIEDSTYEERMKEAVKRAVCTLQNYVRLQLEYKKAPKIEKALRAQYFKNQIGSHKGEVLNASMALLLKDPIHIAIDISVFLNNLQSVDGQRFWREYNLRREIDVRFFKRALGKYLGESDVDKTKLDKIVRKIDESADGLISISEFDRWLGKKSVLEAYQGVQAAAKMKPSEGAASDREIQDGDYSKYSILLDRPPSMTDDILGHLNARFQDSRSPIVRKICEWVEQVDHNATKSIILTAKPGYGKSIMAAMAHSVLKDSDKILASSFFLRADKPTRVEVVTSLMEQMVKRNFILRKHMLLYLIKSIASEDDQGDEESSQDNTRKLNGEKSTQTAGDQSEANKAQPSPNNEQPSLKNQSTPAKEDGGDSGDIQSSKDTSASNRTRVVVVTTTREEGLIYGELKSIMPLQMVPLDFRNENPTGLLIASESGDQKTNLPSPFKSQEIHDSNQSDLIAYTKYLAAQMGLDIASDIAEDLASMSNGLLLWVKLAMAKLREDIIGSGSKSVSAVDIKGIPLQLSDVYKHLLDRSVARLKDTTKVDFENTITTILIAYEPLSTRDLFYLFFYEIGIEADDGSAQSSNHESDSTGSDASKVDLLASPARANQKTLMRLQVFLQDLKCAISRRGPFQEVTEEPITDDDLEEVFRWLDETADSGASGTLHDKGWRSDKGQERLKEYVKAQELSRSDIRYYSNERLRKIDDRTDYLLERSMISSVFINDPQGGSSTQGRQDTDLEENLSRAFVIKPR
ncbi:uncharacterized protein BJ171DRAFT_584160 [Polychytrium aggregatum]|uniref:uncharacterized protein n=1 Tax=Polychytrium aggregatum TaxID=110093 RepID=UPI0022FF0002|nr:uncharacterized protein BJ171DRAFT_584160 [Polychytrium aggregatum]KAI9202510.1 hypothetical protein BJ171DRAFT_584160 [Polychytrium aggregatum]